MPLEGPSLARQPSFTRQRLDDLFRSLHDSELNLAKDIYEKDSTPRGVGATSDVYRAKSKRYKKLVAIKSIRSFLLDDESFAKALEREVRLWSKLEHPNILPFLGFYLDGDNAKPNLVSEWINNGTMDRYLKDRQLDAMEVCNLVSGISSGLIYLHAEGIVHSDLKGSNILISDDGKPLLADFGISISSMTPSLAPTDLHGEKGTLRWMAKELLVHENYSDHTEETDIWAFGMVIYEILSGRQPYWLIPQKHVRETILRGELPQQPEFGHFANPEVFLGLWSICSACWLEVPSERVSCKNVLRKVQRQVFNLMMGISTPIAHGLPGMSGLFTAKTLVESIIGLCANAQDNTKFMGEALHLCEGCKYLSTVIEGVSELGKDPSFIKESMDNFLKFLRRIQEKFKAFFTSNAILSPKAFERDILPIVSWFKTSLEYMTEEFQLSAILRLLADSKQLETARQLYLEKSAREFFRHIFHFGSNVPQLPSPTRGGDVQRDLEVVVQAYKEYADVLGSVSRRRGIIRENLFLDEFAINGLPSGIWLQQDHLRFGTTQPEAVAGSTVFDIYRGTYLAQIVAIKKARAYTSFGKSESVEHFVREAKHWRLACEVDPTEEFILQLIGVSFLDVSFIMVSRWMKNRDLLTYIRKHGEKVDRRRMVRRIAKGLGILHDRSSPIAHGHLKASNIIIKDNGDPLIGDFGLSTSPGDSDVETVSDLEVRGGASLRWFAPEMLVDGALISIRSDIYSFGMTILELMTGEPPFHDIEKDTSIPTAVSEGQRPARPKGSIVKRRGLDDGLWGLLTRCWAHAPEDRPTIFDINRELDGWESSKLSGPASPRTPGRAPRRVDSGASAGSQDKQAGSSVTSRLHLPPESFQAEDESVSGATSHVFDVYRGYYSTQVVAIKSTKALACVDWSAEDLEGVYNAAARWNAACEVDPNEEYLLRLIGISASRETSSVMVISRWMKNRDLLSYINQEAHNLVIDRKHVARRIARAVQILHDQKPACVHGNLRASNIIINENGDPILGGFGLSKAFERILEQHKSEAQEVNSFRWLAPELHDLEDDDETSLSTESDIYALAMTIFELMAGEVPFKHIRKSKHILPAVMKGDRPRRPSGQSIIDRGLDDDLWNLLTRCWAQDPSDRPSILKVNEELDKIWPEYVEALHTCASR